MPHRTDQSRTQVLVYKALPVLAVVTMFTFLMTMVLLVDHIRQAGEERNSLCVVIHSMITRSGAQLGKEGTPGFAYYQDHPMELRAAQRQNRAFLEELPC